MKHLSYIILSFFLLQACGSNFSTVRAKTLKKGDILTFKIIAKDAIVYQVGDTVTLKYEKQTLGHTWKIMNDVRRPDTIYYSESWYTRDSILVPPYKFEYKNVVIDKIISD